MQVSCIYLNTYLHLLQKTLILSSGKWYWVKRIIFYVLFHFRARKNQPRKEKRGDKLRHEAEQVKGYGQGDSNEAMEKPQVLSSHPDVTFFLFYFFFYFLNFQANDFIL